MNKPAQGICIDCGKITEAILGVFELLCPNCLSKKKETKSEKNPTLFKNYESKKTKRTVK